jgi:23S rRNA (uracil1939-C5)-methyltransferase
MSKKHKEKILEQVPILGVAAEGKAIARVNDKVVFVEGAVPGDVADLRVYASKKGYMEAKAIHFHQYSEKRVDAFCSHFGLCGGCKWQHLAYSEQLKYKQQQVIDNLTRIGKVQLPDCQLIIASPVIQYYRNRLDFAFSSKRWIVEGEAEDIADADRNALGFHIPQRFDKVLDIERCYLQADPSNDIRLALKKLALEKGYTFYNLREKQGFLRSLIIRSANTGELMTIVQFFENEPDKIEEVMSFLHNRFPQITSLMYVINQKGNDTFFDQEIITYYGKDFLTEKMEDLQFRIRAKSFYQTNSEGAYRLYKVAREFADLQGTENVYDLYTGTGTIACFVAKQCRQVVGVEYVEMAVEDAKVNAQINGIKNAQFFAGDMKDVLNEAFVSRQGQPDVIITDPPRVGMHESVVKKLLEIGAAKIVYVSCNPATQARDLQWLDPIYSVRRLQPVDMFPHTHHVENVVLLEKRK